MVVEKHLIDSLKIGRKKVKVTMLQYADDTLFFCEANTKNAFNIKATLNCFKLCSGLKENFLKSEIGKLGIDQLMLQRYVAILNCDVMGTPFVYMGMLVGGCHKRGAFWGGEIEIMKPRLCRWKGRFLSLAGKICLIKFVLTSIPLFYLSLFKMPSVVANELVRIQRNFLWGWGVDGRNIIWASWSKVCEPREAEGLGILDLRVFITTLLGKWIWRLGTDKGDLWNEILESKYGGWRSLREGANNGRISLWWKDLKEVWGSEGWGRNFEDAFK